VGWEGKPSCSPHPNRNFKKSVFVGTILNIIHDSSFSQNWPHGLSSDIHTIKIIMTNFLWI